MLIMHIPYMEKKTFTLFINNLLGFLFFFSWEKNCEEQDGIQYEGYMIPVHGVVIHESPVALQVELAKSEHSQSNKGHGEDQAQQRVRSTTALCNTGEHLQVQHFIKSKL